MSTDEGEFIDASGPKVIDVALPVTPVTAISRHGVSQVSGILPVKLAFDNGDVDVLILNEFASRRLLTQLKRILGED